MAAPSRLDTIARAERAKFDFETRAKEAAATAAEARQVIYDALMHWLAPDRESTSEEDTAVGVIMSDLPGLLAALRSAEVIP